MSWIYMELTRLEGVMIMLRQKIKGDSVDKLCCIYLKLDRLFISMFTGFNPYMFIYHAQAMNEKVWIEQLDNGIL